MPSPERRKDTAISAIPSPDKQKAKGTSSLRGGGKRKKDPKKGGWEKNVSLSSTAKRDGEEKAQNRCARKPPRKKEEKRYMKPVVLWACSEVQGKKKGKEGEKRNLPLRGEEEEAGLCGRRGRISRAEMPLARGERNRAFVYNGHRVKGGGGPKGFRPEGRSVPSISHLQ